MTLHCAEGSDVEGVELVPVETGELAAAMVRPGAGTGPPLPAMRDAFRRLYAGVRARRPDAVTQHAFDAEAIEEAEALECRVVHTLHLPPLGGAVVEAARRTRRPLVTVSRAAAHEWARAGVRAVVIPNGVPDFDPGSPPVLPRAVVAGRVSPEKQTHVAIELARRAGLDAEVVGSLYDAGYAARHGIRARRLPRPELWALMAGSAVTLMPVDWEEPFGLVAAESQLAGCPVVAYRRGGLVEVVAEGVGGYLVEPGDEDGFVAAIEAARRLDRGRVRASARERLLIERCAAEYAAILR